MSSWCGSWVSLYNSDDDAAMPTGQASSGRDVYNYDMWDRVTPARIESQLIYNHRWHTDERECDKIASL